LLHQRLLLTRLSASANITPDLSGTQIARP